MVWTVATKTWPDEDGHAVLHAFDVSSVDNPIYASEQNEKHEEQDSPRGSEEALTALALDDYSNY